MRHFRVIVLATVCLLLLVVGVERVLHHPATPLPPAWNPAAPLDVQDPVTAATRWKLQRTIRDREACLTALATSGAAFEPLPDVEAYQEGCGIPNNVRLQSIGARLSQPLDTQCETALRLAMWVQHGLPDATYIEHVGSYSCRAIRTSTGTGNRMSTHATAAAVDVRSIGFADGRIYRLPGDWGPELAAAGEAACRWFGTVLGPDYNALHADHFHLQNRGWGLCR
ncbi:extensin family protein [Aestuariibius sp. 2305UL40-4]|uniref:extensin-like domain-containing protein n=1 Tax=Aestuariibius violaceus TaxID=3234132 RepID=UPI00345E9D1F